MSLLELALAVSRAEPEHRPRGAAGLLEYAGVSALLASLRVVQTLGAAVAEQRGSRVFVLKDHDPAFKEHMLVITTKPLPDLLGEARTSLQAGEKLLLTGVVHREPLAALESELGVQLEESVRTRFEGTPVLVATEVVRTDDREPEAADTAPGY